MMNITCFLAFGAFVCAILSALGKCPTWVVEILLALAILVGCFPIR